jgi:hypothetical protein
VCDIVENVSDCAFQALSVRDSILSTLPLQNIQGDKVTWSSVWTVGQVQHWLDVYHIVQVKC